MSCSSVNLDLFMSGPLARPDSGIRWRRYRGSLHLGALLEIAFHVHLSGDA